MRSKAIHVSVVVPCRNEIRHIRAFLDSVFRQELDQVEMEVLIADGMSEDGTRSVLDESERRFAMLRVIDNPQKIVSTGLNLAISEAKGEIIIRMDVHTFYASDYVCSCLEVLNETNADNVGGPALTRADGFIAQAIAHTFQTRFARGGGKTRDPRYDGLVETVPYGCWRKSTLERIGKFDEKLVRAEDFELNLRLISCGGAVRQSPRIVSWYRPRASLSGLSRQYFQNGFWKAPVVRKYKGIVSWRHFVPSLCLLGGAVLPICAAGARFARLAWWQNAFLVAWLALVASYFIASFAAAFSVARRRGWLFLPFLPVVFATYQLSYAIGFFLALLYRSARWNPPSRTYEAMNTTTK